MNFIEMEQTLSRKLKPKIKQITAPLVDHFGLNEFYHYRLNNNGHFVNVGLNSDYEQYYFSEINHLTSTPYFRHPKFFKTGVSVFSAVQDNDFESFMGFLRKKFNVNLSLQLTRKTSNGVEAFGFGLNSPNLHQHLLLYNAIPLLNHFIDNLKAALIPHTALLENNQVDMASLVGPKFDVDPVPLTLDPTPSNLLLKELGLAPITPLSSREIEVINHLLNGSPASHIADQLQLSKRTVEHYIDNIKDKFRCSTKSDLIKILRKLDSIGYF